MDCSFTAAFTLHLLLVASALPLSLVANPEPSPQAKLAKLAVVQPVPSSNSSPAARSQPISLPNQIPSESQPPLQPAPVPTPAVPAVPLAPSAHGTPVSGAVSLTEKPAPPSGAIRTLEHQNDPVPLQPPSTVAPAVLAASPSGAPAVSEQSEKISSNELHDPALQYMADSMRKKQEYIQHMNQRQASAPLPPPPPPASAGLGQYKVWDNHLSSDEAMNGVRRDLPVPSWHQPLQPIDRFGAPPHPTDPNFQHQAPLSLAAHGVPAPSATGYPNQGPYGQQGGPYGYASPGPDYGSLTTPTPFHQTTLPPHVLNALPKWMQKLSKIDLNRADNMYTEEEIQLKKALYYAARAAEL